MKQSVLIVGVGGQGTLLAGRLLGEYAKAKGLDAKVSEVHGMAQRGGSVVTHVRIGENVASPLIDVQSADVLNNGTFLCIDSFFIQLLKQR